MPRASRHSVAGQVFHLTHRCHKRQWLLKFAKDRHRWIYWLYQARRRYGLVVLTYVVTSNHIHLLVKDRGKGEIAQSMQLIAGRTAQEFNRRKNRRGAFWEDRYQATAVESDAHLARCFTYIDMNMVRAGAVAHPGQWLHGGFSEIQNPRERGGRINFDAVITLLGLSSLDELQKLSLEWVNEAINAESFTRDPTWTESVAVGSEDYVKLMRETLGAKNTGRRIVQVGENFTLREPVIPYIAYFDVENAI